MITCELNGRLGNNLFQIAAGIGHAKKVDSNFILTAPWSDNQFFNQQIEVQDILFKIISPEFGFHYQDLGWNDNIKILGYRQSEKYFDNAKNEVRQQFSFSPNVQQYIFQKYGTVLILPVQKIGVCIRRGDYLQLPDHHPVLNFNYYLEASEHFNIIQNKIFIIFSDDIPWCKTQFIKSKGWPYEDITLFAEGNNAIADLYFLTLCQKFIAANSTFSWWGAWLAMAEDKIVVAPLKKYPWFGPAYNHLKTCDLLPKEWTAL